MSEAAAWSEADPGAEAAEVAAEPGAEAAEVAAPNPRADAGNASTKAAFQITYLLPLRWTSPGPVDELAEYLADLRARCPELSEILVVDGSPEPLYSDHKTALNGLATHMRPEPVPGDPHGQGRRCCHRGAGRPQRADRDRR